MGKWGPERDYHRGDSQSFAPVETNVVWDRWTFSRALCFPDTGCEISNNERLKELLGSAPQTLCLTLRMAPIGYK